MRTYFLFIFLAAAIFLLSNAYGRSAYSPRHTGMEPPGGPRPIEALPSNSPSRTAEGGMGYTDAYGNTVDDVPPEEKKPARRLPPGAYGNYGRQKEAAKPLPDPGASNASPLWKFQ